MNDRMEHALELADRCWGKAYHEYPEFVEKYLYLAHELLESKMTVTGDAFREHCKRNGLYKPRELHHNVWVSGVRALELMGWVSKLSKVEPVEKHNHMPTVTLWRSNLFGVQSSSIPPFQHQTQLPLKLTI